MWAGTDDGLIHVSRDSGAHWENVTPPDMPAWAYVGSIELSPHDADTIYAAATCFKHDDYRPYLYRSKDGGKSWETLNDGFPQNEITRVLRADPEKDGLLFVGTETGVFASLDDGVTWTRMQGGLPVVPIYDLKIKHGDLIAATHGRSFWVLDDVSPLRQLAGPTAGGALAAPRDSHRVTLTWSVGVFDGDGINYSPCFGIAGASYIVTEPDGRTRRKHLDVGENPPNGAIISYWLDKTPETPVTLTLLDSEGKEIRSFSSGDEKPEHRVPSAPGFNRFVWDMTCPPAELFDETLVTRKYVPLAKSSPGSGPVVPPGRYQVVLSIGGTDHRAPLTILKDPRLTTSRKDFDRQYDLARRLTDSRSSLRRTVNGLRDLRRQVHDLRQRTGGVPAALAGHIDRVTQSLDAIEEVLVDIHRETPRDVLRNPAKLDDTLGNLLWTVAMSDTAPATQVVAVAEEVMQKVAAESDRYREIVDTHVSALNAEAVAAGTPAIIL